MTGGKGIRGRVLCLGAACALAAASAAKAEPAACAGTAMPGMTAAWDRFAVVRASARRTAPARFTEVTVVGAYEEFARIAGAVLGTDADSTSEALATIERELSSGRRLAAGCDPRVEARDRAAWKLLAAGYSALEIEDILTGRLERAEIDRARRLLMAGYGQRAAEYLEAAASTHSPSSGPRAVPRNPPRPLAGSNAPVLADADSGAQRAARPRPLARNSATETTLESVRRADDVTDPTPSQAASATDIGLPMRQPLSRALAPRGMDFASVLATPDASRLGEPREAQAGGLGLAAGGLNAPASLRFNPEASDGRLSTLVPTGPSLPAVAPGLRDTIHRYATLYGVDPNLVHAMVDAESRGDQRAVSARGARGLMQLMPGTARMLGVNPHDPLDNLRGGIQYLAGLVRQFGDVSSALIAYNSGPTHAERVRRGEAVLYGETRRYLERIAGLTGVASYLPGGG